MRLGAGSAAGIGLRGAAHCADSMHTGSISGCKWTSLSIRCCRGQIILSGNSSRAHTGGGSIGLICVPRFALSSTRLKKPSGTRRPLSADTNTFTNCLSFAANSSTKSKIATARSGPGCCQVSEAAQSAARHLAIGESASSIGALNNSEPRDRRPWRTDVGFRRTGTCLPRMASWAELGSPWNCWTPGSRVPSMATCWYATPARGFMATTRRSKRGLTSTTSSAATHSGGCSKPRASLHGR